MADDYIHPLLRAATLPKIAFAKSVSEWNTVWT